MTFGNPGDWVVTKPSELLAHLRTLQARRGYLPDDSLVALAEELGQPLHRLHELVSFYPHFRRRPGRPVVVHVCRDMACQHRGAAACFEAMAAEAAAAGQQVAVEWASCLGRCDRAPAAVVESLGEPGVPGSHGDLARLTPTRGAEAVRAWATGVGRSDPYQGPPDWSIDVYQNADCDYRAVAGLVAELEAGGVDRLLAALREAELRGMGGAGVPAWRKWEDVRQARGDCKFVICNADESEPCTFKDREILRYAPHLVIEGMVLGALVVGAEQGYVYIRHEYPEPRHYVEAEIERARALGVIGSNIMGTGRRFELEVFESPGGYVCGEQSALIEAIEGRRSEPRNKPPQIETNGLLDRPTLLNNVETFAWVPGIALRGAGWYANAGVKGSRWYTRRGKDGAKGKRLFSICGDVRKPGVYEMPIGSTLGELIERAGGMAEGRSLKAVAPSGPSGGFLPARLTGADLGRGLPDGVDELGVWDLPLDLDEFRALGLMLGAGLMVIGDGPSSDVLELALGATRFFRNESCGKCVPCRIGSQKLVEIGERIAGGVGRPGDRELVSDLARTLELTSICGLGQSAAKPLESALRFFVEITEKNEAAR
ncbi:MAG: NADH dehydrogenase subunit F [Isosphaeraceae bacterium]|jgi:NADH:ubiquinone oxidoreductase subunit F (NADH-binding)|nr:MAG: NADH dehydrogenase subunit F [Isosphaeraceae bacterium]